MSGAHETSGQGRLRVGIVGASGYAGGELLRLLAGHPGAEIAAATSERHIGKHFHQVHPHLRGRIEGRFVGREALAACDVLFLCLPHGEAQNHIDHYAGLAPTIIDLSADFRLRDGAVYQAAYGEAHHAPEWLPRFVYGLPELYADPLRAARYASGVGCNAAAVTLAVWPLVRAGLLPADQPLVADVKVGSSEAGASPSESSHHPVRAGA
ncbi:MAG: N-acetyl-gamma-glutamyl-phosphate reductase, partial [Anaerolineae bacterium]|nr:N-acetyl-gamma-glutamyl-phosphate reductase [Anaerolineae bacterium]